MGNVDTCTIAIVESDYLNDTEAEIDLEYTKLSHNRKKKLENVVSLEVLSKHKLWIRPRSAKQVLKLVAVYLWLLLFNGPFIMGYIESRNIMLLFIASFFLFVFLLASRVTVEEGHTTVKFKD